MGSIVAIWVGVGVANEEYFRAGVIVVLSTWALLTWRGGPLPEAWILAFALVGYIIGNRGFAQLSLMSQLPLLPAEAALLVGLFATTLRTARHQTAPLRRDALNFWLCAWMLLGAARLWPDVRAHGVIAVRDFATVYYALFFFIAQALAAHAPSLQLLRRALIIACTALPITYALYRQFGDVWVHVLAFRGVPLVFYKDDLVAAYLVSGVFLAMTVSSWSAPVRFGIAALGFVSVFTINSSRAALVGLGVATVWWSAARRWAPVKLQAGVIPVAATILVLVALTSHQDFKQSRAYALYEHVASMLDVSGTRRYASTEREFVGDNNRFRLVWWRSVIDETLEGGPVLGLGFGTDLSERFLRTYDLDLGEEFTARSPHSILFTVFGRMGLLGLLAFLAIVGAMIGRTMQLVQLARHDIRAIPVLGWWSVVWILFASGCFGVVLEGPMGAVVFWTSLGCANVTTAELLRERAETAAANAERLQQAKAPDEVPLIAT